MAWIVLTAAGLLEIVWAMALRHTEGFTRPWPSALAVSTALLSFVMLAWALKSLPVGTAYAVWVGIGAVGVAIAGIVTLDESAAPARLVFLGLIVVGIAGLKAVEG
jgi:quaternary ammonium compound-resistance protein SugE